MSDVCVQPHSGELRTQKSKSHLVKNTEIKRSPFKAWSRSVYSHTCYAYCQEFLPCLFLPFQSIHLHIFQNLSRVFTVLAVSNTGSCVGPQNKTDHPAGCRFPRWVLVEYKQAPKHVILFFSFCVPKLLIEFEVWFERKKEDLWYNDYGVNNLEIDWSLCSALM